MFSYYGSKSKVVKHYPAPLFDNIIEPFAGSARYSLMYFDRDITIVDKYPVIINVWKYLQDCSPKDILSLPRYKTGGNIIREELDCDAQYELIRFLMQQGTVAGIKCYEWGVKAYEPNLVRIAGELHKIKHWKFLNQDYTQLQNVTATWFIDPPYQVGGHKYKCNNKSIDFKELANWCESREGQSIVCENSNATWMDFKPMSIMTGIRKKTTECYWTNSTLQLTKKSA